MSLLPVDTQCSAATQDFSYDTNNPPRCTPHAFETMTMYPSPINCKSTDQMSNPDITSCFIVYNANQNGDGMTGTSTGIKNCCTAIHTHLPNATGPGNSSNTTLYGGYASDCVWGCVAENLTEFNSCLNKYNYGPSYSNMGAVRDTYCVYKDEVQKVDRNSSASEPYTDAAGSKATASVKTTLGIATLLLTSSLFL